MKHVRKAALTAKIGIFSTLLVATLILRPVYERWPHSLLAYLLTLTFALTLLTFAFQLAAIIVADLVSAVRLVGSLLSRLFRSR